MNICFICMRVLRLQSCSKKSSFRLSISKGNIPIELNAITVLVFLCIDCMNLRHWVCRRSKGTSSFLSVWTIMHGAWLSQPYTNSAWVNSVRVNLDLYFNTIYSTMVETWSTLLTHIIGLYETYIIGLDLHELILNIF